MKLIISIVLAIGLQNASSYMLNRLPIGNLVFGREILQKITTNSLPENHFKKFDFIFHLLQCTSKYFELANNSLSSIKAIFIFKFFNVSFIGSVGGRLIKKDGFTSLF